MLNKLKFSLSVFLIVTLSGCMYPSEDLAQNQIPYKEQIDSVQSAVDRFQEDNGGILPIKTKDMETPIYEKYLIDFNKIAPRYIESPPGNAFESGGIFQYVLIDVETNPTVKLLDLRIADKIREIKIRISASGFPPYKDKIAPNVYTLNFKELGYKEDQFAISPFTQQNLPFVVNGEAEVYVDYRSDIYQALKESDKNFKKGEDIRSILTDNSMFVPAYSLPYTIDDKGEPVFIQNKGQ
ncbi:hypothetical protein [Bacillus sp. EB01]|uniref:hypothetical protein n=1 Tax=Bacillus sp. EB01 TaxID=1347086 RepID=UPI0005C602B0|nr:hypothetical protein [Bacillus sp. EB01]